jgi:hypothetical protein
MRAFARLKPLCGCPSKGCPAVSRASRRPSKNLTRTCIVLRPSGATPVPGTSPETGPSGAANIARSINPTAFFHQLVPDLGTLWAETEVSAPVAGIPRLHLAGHIDNVLSIGARKPLAEAVGVAPTSLDRVARLTRKGVIEGIHARINPEGSDGRFWPS